MTFPPSDWPLGAEALADGRSDPDLLRTMERVFGRDVDLMTLAVGFCINRMKAMSAVRAYVVFNNQMLPWLDEVTVYVTDNAEPRNFVPLLKEAVDLASSPRGPLTNPWLPVSPVTAATHLIASSPRTVLPHSRVVSKREGPRTILWNDEDLANVYRKNLAPERLPVDYLYYVRCGPEWWVEVSARVPERNPCGEVMQDGTRTCMQYRVAHQLRPLEDLLKLVDRLGSFAELGGHSEDY